MFPTYVTNNPNKQQEQDRENNKDTSYKNGTCHNTGPHEDLQLLFETFVDMVVLCLQQQVCNYKK